MSWLQLSSDIEVLASTSSHVKTREDLGEIEEDAHACGIMLSRSLHLDPTMASFLAR